MRSRNEWRAVATLAPYLLEYKWRVVIALAFATLGFWLTAASTGATAIAFTAAVAVLALLLVYAGLVKLVRPAAVRTTLRTAGSAASRKFVPECQPPTLLFTTPEELCSNSSISARSRMFRLFPSAML